MGMTSRSRRRVELALSWLGALAAVVFVVAAIAAAVPPSLANLTSTVSDGVAPQSLEVDGREASIVVPDGWVVQRESDGSLRAVTPDGALTARIALHDPGAPDAPLEADGGVLRTEVLASGLTVVHADVDEGVSAAIELSGGGTVGVVATVGGGHALVDYRPALAQLLEGVVP